MPALAASPDSSALTPPPGSSAQTPRSPAFALPVRARSLAGFPIAESLPLTRCRRRCHTIPPNPIARSPSCAAHPLRPAPRTPRTSSTLRLPFSVPRAATCPRETLARSAAARTTPHPTSALPSCSLPEPVPRILDPAAPYSSALANRRSPSTALACPKSSAVLRSPCSCGPTFVLPRSLAARLARSCPAQSESPRAPPVSAASVDPASGPELAPPVPPAPVAAYIASAPALCSAAIETSARPCAARRNLFVIFPVARIAPALTECCLRPPDTSLRERPTLPQRLRLAPRSILEVLGLESGRTPPATFR